MAFGLWWRAALTVMFLVAALLYVVAVRAAAGWDRRSAWIVHAAGAVLMAAMMWPVGMAVPALAYLLLFSAGALYLVFVGLFRSAVAHWPHHALMMASMAAMLITMAPTVPAVTGKGMPAHGHAMVMSAAPTAPTVTPPWLQVSTATLAGLLFLSSARWFYELIRGPQRPYADVLMAVAMGTYFALCI
ncbi:MULTISPECIES: DUF5134 domain-containing protein [unclassified Mycolicibacterium]|uniref:DUF5134 domain-containing protein n=1 Tax=unclassified Mycolicibacterium TaxID=2636767 RepID=UPI002EDA9044